MKSLFVAASLIAGVACADPSLVLRDPPTVVERDISTVTSAVTQVDSSLKNLNQAVQSFSGDPQQLNQAAESMVNTLNTATSQIQQTSNLTVEDALSLQSSVAGIQADGESLLSNLEAKKPAIQAAGLCGQVFQQTSGIATAAQMLVGAVVAKLPVSVQSVGSALGAGVSDTLMRPMQEFSPANCSEGAAPSGPITAAPTASGTGRPATARPSASIFANTTATRTTTTRNGPATTSTDITPFTNAGAPVPARAAGPMGFIAGFLAALVL